MKGKPGPSKMVDHHCRVEGRTKESAATTWVFEIAESSTQVGAAVRHCLRPIGLFFAEQHLSLVRDVIALDQGMS